MESVSNVFKNSPRQDIVTFVLTMIIVYMIVITSLINLTLYPSAESRSMWLTFIAGSVGFIAPNPKLKIIERLETKVAPNPTKEYEDQIDSNGSSP